jgi:signal transduction histidine kinase/CheY-like chemotaxis protein
MLVPAAGAGPADRQVRTLIEELRRSLEDHETLLRVLPVGVFIARDPACAEISVNPAGAAMLRIPADANASKTGPGGDGLPFRVFQNGVEVPGHHLPMQRAARSGRAVTSEEFDIVFEDGSTVTLLEHACPLFNEAGKVRGCVGVFVDITGQKQVEQALRHREEQLQEADRRKDNFLAVLAHELRNPLAPVRTGLQLIRMAGGTPDAVEQVRGTMERQIGHMVRLIDDLLDISRITSGRIQLKRKATPLGELVQGAVDATHTILTEAGVHLTVEVPQPGYLLDVDPTRFVQVISNLLHNAAKFTPPDGRVELRAELQPEMDSGSDELVLSVSDSGVGIAADLLPHVFDLFAQGDRLGFQSRSGLGIGLALARQLIELHGGSITAESAGPGEGTTFLVRLPVSAVDAAGDSDPSAATAVRASGRRVLVIDDNVDAAETLALLVRALGGEARMATSGLSGIEIARIFQPDLILLDIGMPGIDGYETCQRLRLEPFGRSVCIVALTGWGQEQDKRRAMEAGFDIHLTKPADPMLLERLLLGADVSDIR